MKVTRDGDYVLIKIPDRDINSMVRFIAHSIEQRKDVFLDMVETIVKGDLSKQDDVVNRLAEFLDLRNWSVVLDGAESLALCDELAERVYEKEPEKIVDVWRICVHCHKSYLGQCQCPEFKRSQLKVVK